ncbi:hypothetical protein THIAE_02315 [Thiomicrospira aerophila AL3]|uniref:Uncharacterized protein n=1 Tax=Thiomicrospira aerophila AL3 TaxID=717772 RepID=W0DZD0_9GAMM|nr:hypothetical protein [Thiomicrospira aerophila]AHF02191.1 hypothetical protein THIAE_02315 [Thiomicrospira aerophila AL3]
MIKADELLQRLQAIDLAQLNPQEVEQQVLGKRVWLHTFTFPITIGILAIFTLLATWLVNNMLYGFLVALLVVWFLGKLFESYEHDTQRQVQARLEEIIKGIEGEQGLLIHFSAFLPKRYGALLQALRKQRYGYVLQYYQAATLLQKRLDQARFKKYWHSKYPEMDPELSDESTDDYANTGQQKTA